MKLLTKEFGKRKNMAFVKKFNDGKYYLCRSKHFNKGRMKAGAIFYDWFFIKNSSEKKSSCIIIKSISLPEELVGKKIRFVVEIKND